jgi:hypothetical protein
MLELDRLSGQLGASTLDSGLARQVRARIDPLVDELHMAVGHRSRGLLERGAHLFPADLLSAMGCIAVTSSLWDQISGKAVTSMRLSPE